MAKVPEKIKAAVKKMAGKGLSPMRISEQLGVSYSVAHYYAAGIYMPKTAPRMSPQERKRLDRIRKLAERYGLTPEQLAEMQDAAKGICAICGTEGELHIDHDHKTNKVRGLLCPRCNKGLGFFRDNTKFLDSAKTYLEKSS